MPLPTTSLTGYLHVNLMNLDRVARTLIIKVELSEQSARDVCAFINNGKDYGLQLGECWLSNVEGGERASAESLKSAQTRIGDDYSSTAALVDTRFRLLTDAVLRSRN